MSKDTLAALHAAIQAHINADANEPTLVTGWLISFASATSDDTITTLGYRDSDLPMHEAWGLAKFADKYLDGHYEACNQ